MQNGHTWAKRTETIGKSTIGFVKKSVKSLFIVKTTKENVNEIPRMSSLYSYMYDQL